jgi:hypothetical protein
MRKDCVRGSGSEERREERLLERKEALDSQRDG